MFQIKELCAWYGVGYETMRRILKEEGVIPQDDTGRGNRKRLPLSKLVPVFKKYGRPPGITLTIEF